MAQDKTKDSGAEILIRDPEFKPHLDSLGMQTIVEYQKWCDRQGFSMSLDKNWKERCHERYVFHEASIQKRLRADKSLKRRPQKAIARIFDGEIDESQLTRPELSLIQQVVTNSTDANALAAFRKLTLHLERYGSLISSARASAQLADGASNQWISGLAQLSEFHAQWRRPVETWKPKSRNLRRQFSSLAQHLLTRYPTPKFMEHVWFLDASTESRKFREWYVLLGNGISPRKLDLPFSMTKTMARQFLNAPGHYLVNEALRWGQVFGLGGAERMVDAILGSRIGTSFDNNDFWNTVIEWYARHPMLDPKQIGPIFDYLYRRKFELHRFAAGEGEYETRAIDPDFTIEGKTPQGLLQRMYRWHAELRKEPGQHIELDWRPSGMGALDWTESTASNDSLRWTIVELLNRQQLSHEGQQLRHCVASYANSCSMGGTSIWSLGVKRNLGRRKQVMTIEVETDSKSIHQIRGRCNRLPKQKEMEVIRRWAKQEWLTISPRLLAG